MLLAGTAGRDWGKASFKFEMSPPGGEFATVMDGKATKK
jgi:hypothetical protein